MNLNELRDMVHRTAVEHGWWDWSAIKVCCEFPAATRDDLTVNEVGAKLALVHSEVSEALECVRENPSGIVAPSTHLLPNPDGTLGKPEGFGSELADVVIRVLDLCGALGIDIETELLAKHRYNETRPLRHGGEGVVTDRINPPHYKSRSIECIDVAERLTFCAGNALKYIWRAGEKPGVPASEDWAKAAWYLRRCYVRLEPRSHGDVVALEEAAASFTDDAEKRDVLETMAFDYGIAATKCQIIADRLRVCDVRAAIGESLHLCPEEDCDEPTKGDECVG